MTSRYGRCILSSCSRLAAPATSAVAGGQSKLRLLPLALASRAQCLSSYVHDHYHQIQKSNAGIRDDPVYNAQEVRQWLLQFGGGRVTLDRDEGSGIAVVTLDYPEKRNALSGKMMVELSDHISTLEHWAEIGAGRSLILRGAARAFCSGGDLDFMLQIAQPSLGCKMSIWMQHICVRLIQLPLLSVALIEGHAIGGGAELTMACDWRVMDPQAHLGFVHGKLGITTGWSAGTLLTRRFGYKTALAAMTSAHSYSAVEAKEAGFVDEVLTPATSAKSDAEVAQENLKQTTQFLHRFMDNVSPEVGRICKQVAVTASDSIGWADSLRQERDLFTKLWGTPAHVEAMKSRTKKN